ncbi:hypothetical protein [Actinokineospora diospyrosa]|uniref:hypothetical protein n=1 Tax=Actinokineospora diospyrosa TaxID=103728 RepID=UPI0020A488D9|nr:hypothetical protein [Actinokineospora diospyrosa]
MDRPGQGPGGRGHRTAPSGVPGWATLRARRRDWYNDPPRAGDAVRRVSLLFAGVAISGHGPVTSAYG